VAVRLVTGRSATLTAALLVIVGVLLRLAPHPWNVTPVGAAALFAGAYLPLRMAVLVPVGTLAISDLLIGSHSLWWATWGACALGVLLGTLLRGRRGAGPVIGASLASSVTFFVLTNLAVWVEGLLYPRTWEGLVACYVAAIPFFRNSLLGDLLWTGVLFGGWALATRMLGATADLRDVQRE
jgi:hypothetical protein